ncbi:carboxypeptidase regulatory-like domain-containing protein [Mucilaginibacter psychrotolerans]|uniref:TonB-dependent receptor n=1 Tax=Mucilaginibacter psychrotolerans TaxID=1524096 RepID=A0A4Y8RXD3_9SPHI|nr:carboxypeptidase regulatory-like domain-containing protein [Mucilaginibacter psychrotolerans]TFF30382.1 TonB-dependent receptor [Mucilaginibacter psychrotolerans]
MAFKKFFPGVLLVACAAAILGFVAIDDPIGKIQQQLAKWADTNPVEKAYLHLDKPYYAAGDDIWFKAYVTSDSYHELTTLSGVLNVDLTDATGTIKQSLKLQLDKGTAAGDFALPDTLHAGVYHLRAYTNYMRNAGSEYFFDTEISIINTISNANTVTTGKSIPAKAVPSGAIVANPSLQFFPEGGSMIVGLDCNMAFKAIGPTGLGLDVSGIVSNNQGKQVATFKSGHLGMGVFRFVPMPSETYTAAITYADGTKATVSLPHASETGYALAITDADAQNLSVKITTARATMQQYPNRVLSLVGQSAGKVYYAGRSTPGSREFTAIVPKSKFPAGIVQFTLFTDSGEPLNERLVFINRPQLKLSLAADKLTSAPQQKVKLNLNALSGDKPALGSFSVSVIDESRVPVNEDSENNILASLLLTSDLKGYIEKPAYYFNHPGDKARTDLDVLMLTQGYRRFEWKSIMQDKFAPVAFQPETALQVSGTITTPGGKPVANAKVQLIDIDNATYQIDTLTDAHGRFAFTGLAFEDSIRLIIQARTEKNKRDVVITFDSIAPPATIAGHAAPILVSISDSLSVYATSSKQLYDMQRRYGVGNHVISLREVIIREKKIALKHSANLNGPGNADQVLLAKDLRNYGCAFLSDCLQGRLLGVIFRNGIPYSTRGFGPMQVILDGMYVDGSFLNSINYNDIAAIEVLRSGFSTSIYGGRAANGVIVITTKRGDENDNTYDGPVAGRGIKPYYPKGYLKARTFYSPQYDQPKVNKQLADLRSTIYWNPFVITDAQGKASFEYFNAGGKGTYRVVIEGIDTDGNLGRQVYRYKVE